MIVTLIGRKLAKEGVEFTYVGITKRCRSCRLKTVCSNLEEGRKYKITKVRDKVHRCDLHGEVVAVEVEKLPIEANIKKEQAEATAIEFHPIKCEFIGCKEYEHCSPGVKEKKYKILKIVGDVKCPKGYELKKVLLDDMK